MGVLGTVLNFRYQAIMTPLLAHQPIPTEVAKVILGSLGGALAVAERVPGSTGAVLAETARRSFVSGMDLGFVVAAGVVAVAGVIVLVVLPNRARAVDPEEDLVSSDR